MLTILFELIKSFGKFLAWRPTWAARLGRAQGLSWLVLGLYAVGIFNVFNLLAQQDKSGVMGPGLVAAITAAFTVLMVFFAWLPAWVLKQPQQQALLRIGLCFTSAAVWLWFVGLLVLSLLLLEGAVTWLGVTPLQHMGQVVALLVGVALVTFTVAILYLAFVARTTLQLVSPWQGYALGVLLVTGIILFKILAMGLLGQLLITTPVGLDPTTLGTPTPLVP